MLSEQGWQVLSAKLYSVLAGHTVQPAAEVMPVALLELPLLQGMHDAEPGMEA